MSIKMIDASVLESQDENLLADSRARPWGFTYRHSVEAKFISLYTRLYIYGRPDANFRATPFISSHAF